MLDGTMLLTTAAAMPPIALVASATDADVIAVDTRLRQPLLKALVNMAIRSKRRQADLSVAMRRAGLTPTRESISAALTSLFDDGLIDDFVPLSDGGLLLSVTSLGVERLQGAPVALAAA